MERRTGGGGEMESGWRASRGRGWNQRETRRACVLLLTTLALLPWPLPANLVVPYSLAQLPSLARI
jgi:hypothetical protein